jgi:hypothetical protein
LGQLARVSQLHHLIPKMAVAQKTLPEPPLSVLRFFSAKLRTLSPTEHALVQEWLGLAGDVPLVYVSQQRSVLAEW